MLQEFVDNVIAVTKESVKTFTYEALNNIARFINGISALLLTLLPGKGNILEGISGWELKPALRGPRLPRWMESGVSSFNEFIHDLSVDSDAESVADSIPGDDDNEEFVCPPSPISQSSRLSHASSFGRRDRRMRRHIRYAVSWILWPLRFFLSLLFILFNAIKFWIVRTPAKSRERTESPHLSRTGPAKRSFHIRDQFLQRTTDKRRGVFEDLHLAIEIFIESVFDIVHKGAHYVLSPSEVWHNVYCWIYGSGRESSSVVDVPAANVGSENPAPTEKKTVYRHSLNTDSRTCEDVITELGYPFEAIKVVTSDGYVLLVERIPRRDSRKVVLLQHGILDSSMGWVSNGVVGSPAFAAYDQGYDVFLGNLRGLVSREHIDKNISSYKYWGYSVNEHGTKDMPAIIEEIHKIKSSELGKRQILSGEKTEEQYEIKNLEAQASQDNSTEDQPYKLCAVCHSLGGAVMLMYVVTSRIVQKPHRLSRLILLSPAGFHEDSNLVFSVVEKLMLFVGPVLAPVIPGLYIPTRFFRMLLNKLARDFHNYPALGGLVQTFMGYIVGGDSSNWVGVLGLPHYNMDDMPGVSFRVALHLAQIKRAKKFQMYDYGSTAANMESYGMPEPLDLGANYGLIDIPVDLVAGQRDRVVSPTMVKKHYKLMRKAGVEVSYNEFEYAHLDFTFSHREELLSYVMSRLLLVSDSDKGSIKHTTVRRRKPKIVHSEIEDECDIVACGGEGEEANESTGHSA